MDWDIKLEREKSKIVLVVNNCPAHKLNVELKMIKLCYMPPNLTSKIQPLDQGIIKSIKANFNEKKFTHIIEKIEAGEDVFSSYKNITLMDAIFFLISSWNKISDTTIKNCFKHAEWEGNVEPTENFVDNKIESYSEFINKANLLDCVEEKEFLEYGYDFTDVLASEDILENEDKEMSLDEKLERDEVTEPFDSEQDFIKFLEEEEPSKKELYTAFNVIKKYFNIPSNFEENAASGIELISKSLKKKRSSNLLDWVITKK